MIKHEYEKKYKLDEDMFKEVRILREDMRNFDVTSEDVKGAYTHKMHPKGECR
jgi:hypothetical protein